MPKERQNINEIEKEMRDKRMKEWHANFVQHPEEAFQELMSQIRGMRREIQDLRRKFKIHIHVDGELALKDDRSFGSGESMSDSRARQVLPPERR